MKPWPLPKIDAVLALDIATKTGFSRVHRAGDEYDPDAIGRGPLTGTWELELPPWKTVKRLFGRHWDPRPGTMFRRVEACLQAQPNTTTLVVWEDVEFVSSRDQITCWSGLRAAVWCACEQVTLAGGARSLFYSVPVGTLKKFATGSGQATKVDMERAAVKCKLVPASHGFDDNAIDARWILEYALRTYSGSVASAFDSRAFRVVG